MPTEELRSADHVRLRMIRESLENIPEFAVPEGYALRWYQPGDETHWCNIHAEADAYNRITEDFFGQQFGTDPGALEKRQLYLLSSVRQPIGTGTAWFDRFEEELIGRVHWVAMLPEYQGLGLSKPLLTAVCRRLAELGHKRAYLSTAAARRPAIQLYRSFGFVPWIRTEADERAWRETLGPTLR